MRHQPRGRVVFVAGTLGVGGAERQLHHQVGACLRLGFEPFVLCLTQGEAWEPRIQELGAPVVWVGASPSRALRAARIAREVRRLRPQVVQSAHFYTNLYAVVAARSAGACSVGAVRGDLRLELQTHRVLGKASLRLPHLLAVNSTVALERAVGLGWRREDVFYLPNALDPTQYAPAGDQVLDRMMILGIGRQVRVKRYDRFLEVVARVRERMPHSRALLVGDGPERGALEARVQDLGLGDSVTFLPLTDRTVECYHQASLLLVTSEQEGSPNVVLEAMGCGLPVVAMRAGGTEAALENGISGRLVEQGDVAGAADAVVELLQDREQARRMGAAGRTIVMERHGPRRLEEALATLYARALSLARA